MQVRQKCHISSNHMSRNGVTDIQGEFGTCNGELTGIASVGGIAYQHRTRRHALNSAFNRFASRFINRSIIP